MKPSQRGRRSGRFSSIGGAGGRFHPGEEGGTVVTESADTVDVTHVVLGLGNLPPRDPPVAGAPFLSKPRYVRNVWHADAWQGLSPDESVLIAGSGLTAVDLISTLAAATMRGRSM